MLGGHNGENQTVDVTGIGFGPSNLAFAVAVEEHNQTAPPGQAVTARFFERQPAFGWHRGMLIEGASMQVSFLKDLVTMRNPVSSYGYLSYLHSRGRLAHFINAKSFFPLRVEFHDYLEWVAEQCAHLVDYGCEVLDIEPVGGPGGTDRLDVVVRRADGRTLRQRTRNVVIATGIEPVLPEGLPDDDRIWHSSRLLGEIGRLRGRPSAFVVLGAGQSAAEVVAHLHSVFPDAHVHAVFSRYGYSAADDSAYTNRIFDPEAVDHHFGSPPQLKEAFLRYHGNTNYSVVDIDLIDDLYRRGYLEMVTGRERLHVRNATRLHCVSPGPDALAVDLEFTPTGRRETVAADVVVCATGYRPCDPLGLLGSTASRCKQDEAGRLEVARNYRVSGEETLRCGIYVQGGATEYSHGITSSLLSTTAVRAGEILSSIVAQRDADAAA
ncbi:lysine N(6)-hydroxylase/L-ornithine N(5)-oxygenase family protein [Streptomyces sp. IBSBF 2435]|uniref:lysine N(6)-hydroxylase/L-ornithine N(5)-oxygenase family protein n=1 Tax=Streptomyces sp. IBSBF 2435 TaxID=2903531 RepID=UPI002FDC5AC8